MVEVNEYQTVWTFKLGPSSYTVLQRWDVPNDAENVKPVQIKVTTRYESGKPLNFTFVK